MLVAAAAAGALIGAGLLAGWGDGTVAGESPPFATQVADRPGIPLAVLGDSNSHSYQDFLTFPAGGTERGGALRAQTLQWTEVLAQLRGQQLDLGPWVRWGRPGVVARGREWLGLSGGRAPAKEDFLYNFANSGAACKNLMRGRFRQAPRLVELMRMAPARWKDGVVVIRIGLNDWAGQMELQARDPAAAELQRIARFCAGEVRAAIDLIHQAQPSVRVLVVGIGNEADDPAQFERWRSASETANLAAALARFNGALRALTEGRPRVAYFDDVEWFEGLWGQRDAAGKPAYRSVQIGERLRVQNTAGDAPHHALLADHHAGLVWNALWAQALVRRLNGAFDLRIAPITDAELEAFVSKTTGARAPGS